MDTLAFNFSPTATFDDGSCELPNLGCTDILSLNYDPDANFEDGSCEYSIICSDDQNLVFLSLVFSRSL